MFHRNAIDNLIHWSQKEDRKPLILRGARQVGKTTLVDLFSNKFDQYIYMNLELDEDKKIFDNSKSINQLIDAIFLYKNKLKSEKRTLIFIDEIQNSSTAVKWLRYFYEDAKNLYVIAAGSLLETLIDNQVSFPVGRVEYLPVYPFSFLEFLLAMDETESISVLTKIPFPEYAHDKLLELFRLYTLIGGMPDIVKHYKQHRDLIALNNIYDGLITSYSDDVEKYARSTTHKQTIRHIINHSFKEAGSRIKFQGFGNSNYKSREMKEAFLTLEKALLIKLVYPVISTKIPLVPNFKKSPKLQVMDTGLINFAAGLHMEIFGSNQLLDVYKGKIAEHIVAQELIALNKLITKEIYFWTREKDSDAEIDFVYQYKSMLLPIEVKSGATGSLRSLHEYIDRADHAFGIRVYSGKLSIEKSKTRTGKNYLLLNLPLYLVHKIDVYIRWFIGTHGEYD